MNYNTVDLRDYTVRLSKKEIIGVIDAVRKHGLEWVIEHREYLRGFEPLKVISAKIRAHLRKDKFPELEEAPLCQIYELLLSTLHEESADVIPGLVADILSVVEVVEEQAPEEVVTNKKLDTGRLINSSMREAVKEIDTLLDHYLLRNGNITKEAFHVAGCRVIHSVRGAIGLSGIWTHLNDLPIGPELYSSNGCMVVYLPSIGDIKASIVEWYSEKSPDKVKNMVAITLQLIVGTFYNLATTTIHKSKRDEDLENGFIVEEMLDTELIREIIAELDDLIYDGRGRLLEFHNYNGRNVRLHSDFKPFGTRRR